VGVRRLVPLPDGEAQVNRYILNRLAGRVMRRVLGMQRESVRQLTEADYRVIDVGYAFVAATAAMVIMATVLWFVSVRPTC